MPASLGGGGLLHHAHATAAARRGGRQGGHCGLVWPPRAFLSILGLDRHGPPSAPSVSAEGKSSPSGVTQGRGHGLEWSPSLSVLDSSHIRGGRSIRAFSRTVDLCCFVARCGTDAIQNAHGWGLRPAVRVPDGRAEPRSEALTQSPARPPFETDGGWWTEGGVTPPPPRFWVCPGVLSV